MNIDETPKHLISLEAGWFDYAQSLLSEMAFICHVKRLPCVRGVVELGGGLGATYSSLGRNRLGGRLGVGKSIHTVPHSPAIIAYGVYSPRKLKCISRWSPDLSPPSLGVGSVLWIQCYVCTSGLVHVRKEGSQVCD